MTSKLYLPRRQVVIYMYLTYCLKKKKFRIMMDDGIGELVLTVIHLQAPLESGKISCTCPPVHLCQDSTIIYHKIHITRFAMEFVWL